MAETGVHWSSGLMRWAILASGLVALLVVYGLCVPFRSSSFFIDRRTGAYHGDTFYFGIPIQRDRPVATPVRGNPNGKGPLTSPERRILAFQRIQRFPWTEAVTVHDDVGIWYAEAFHQLFYFASWERPKGRKLSEDELDKIVKGRIPSWNSPELDRNPQAVAEAARQENSDLLGIPVEHVFER